MKTKRNQGSEYTWIIVTGNINNLSKREIDSGLMSRGYDPVFEMIVKHVKKEPEHH